ncbi:receptor kinase-like protein Xa21 isoform X2 [Cornus florida]|uniref:receptor kinase-like protein Xa21 isoform X2 n=1 Tax=Cornus florida TaxID=4283 RepID=UPI0028A0AC55|nr:receptor kinase-like protein Xa21 isoform X2 [Cornus florida]
MIVLSNNSLSGSLPVDMCSHLPELELLYLAQNQFNGQIPSNLYRCRKLQVLSLLFNEFNGSIPREIGNLTTLKELYLGKNSLEGVIPSEIGNLPHLEILSFQSGSLTGSIPSSIFNISSLRSIDFANNSLSGNLPVSINNDFPVLEELYLHRNQLTGHIPSNLWECRGLRVLQLSYNKFTGSISKNIGNLTLLKDLYLSGNSFTGTLPDEIGNLNLEGFSIHQNSLTGLIPSNIFNVTTMKFFDLNDNQFSGHLPSTMGLWLPSLEELYLGSNKFSGKIPSTISNCSKLTILVMGSNSFTGSIPNTLGSLTLLQRLLVGENNLTVESSTGELRFFTALTNCRHLELVSISLNQFNGMLPDSLGNLSISLRRLEAFGCKIKGSIPSGIGNLSSMDAILLDSNELSGPIPTTIGGLQNLERLYLEHNRLQGPIPNDLCKLTKLGDIYASNNKLYGPIPKCLGELKSLRRLYLDSNNLTSVIPPNLWSLEDLLGLNLSTNSLRGNLPLDIGNLKVITQLDLSWNQLSGDIPSTIGSAQSLVNFSLAHNELQGHIPQSLGNLISLEFLDLSNNNFSGEIPKSLEMLRYLQYLNVSFNRLQGEIPTGGHFVNFTAQSFMHNDALCGLAQLQVPLCKTNKNQRSRSKIVPLLKYILPPIALITLVVALIIVLIRRKRMVKLSTNADLSPLTWRRISYLELLQATDGFSEANLLGVGSFGSVYKGTLSDGMIIAIKVFNLQLERAIKSFDVECEVICNTRHRNLIRIISSCTNNMDFRALVLEYMPNGSFEKWLYSHNYCLDILQRLNIMIDVASALEYLHHGHVTPIVHCDLKPENVLLDEDMIAHVADFGIAKLFGEGDLMAQTTTLATIGYMAPEYGMEGRVSTRCDVYSYGVLLMEIFTRKRPTDEMFAGEMSLRRWVKEALDGSIIEVVDSNLIGTEDENFSVKEECVSYILGLALDCSSDKPVERIDMKEVLVRLEKIKISFSENIGMAGKKKAMN